MSPNQVQERLFPDPVVGASVVTNEEIVAAVNRGLLISRSTFDRSNLELCSYDVRVGWKAILGGTGNEIDLQSDSLELKPGAYAGVVSLEKFILPADTFARIGAKRSFSYEGVILLTGAIIDPGYEGHLLFGLYNASQKRAIIRSRRKICNVVFERLSKPIENAGSSDPDLISGNFPDDFVNKMANMEVLPWQQISERVGLIEQITKDILDLRARYEDVLEPIRRLTENVNSLANDVSSLTSSVANLHNMAADNARQITQLTISLTTIVSQVGVVQDRTRSLDEKEGLLSDRVTALIGRFGRYELVAYIFWALLLLGAGAALAFFVPKLFGQP